MSKHAQALPLFISPSPLLSPSNTRTHTNTQTEIPNGVFGTVQICIIKR